MMARANLGQLLGNVGESTPPVGAAAQPDEALEVGEPAPPVVAAKAPRLASRVAPATEKQAAKGSYQDPATPAYLRYVRKETRLREDQQNQLTLQARRLNRAKKNRGARITENSLIRVAIDLFLAQIDRAAGDDEDTIRKSMTP
jgi:hypothetical protein